MGNSTDGQQLFYPAVWPAPFCHKGSTSKQPRQGAHECVQVPWAPFSNIFKAVPSIEMPWQWLIFDLWVKIYKLEFFWIFFPQEGSQISGAKLRFYWRKINLCPPTVHFRTVRRQCTLPMTTASTTRNEGHCQETLYSAQSTQYVEIKS